MYEPSLTTDRPLPYTPTKDIVPSTLATNSEVENKVNQFKMVSPKEIVPIPVVKEKEGTGLTSKRKKDKPTILTSSPYLDELKSKASGIKKTNPRNKKARKSLFTKPKPQVKNDSEDTEEEEIELVFNDEEDTLNEFSDSDQEK